MIAIALTIWWSANTLSHHFIHRPCFRRTPANACAAACLTLLTGIPQPLWRERHLAHDPPTAAEIAAAGGTASAELLDVTDAATLPTS